MFFGRTTKKTDEQINNEATLPETQSEELADFGPVIDYLKEVKVAYTLVQKEKLLAYIEKEQSLEIAAKVLQDNRGMLMVLLPAQYLLDYTLLVGAVQRELIPLSPQDANAPYPLPDYYQLEAVIDESLKNFSSYYFKIEGTDQYLFLKADAFFIAHEKYPLAKFTDSLESIKNKSETETQEPDLFSALKMKGRLEETFELPAIPTMADAILRLRVDPKAEAKHLAAIVEKDPSLAAQVMSWAQSPYYGFAGTVTSVEMAIVKVLGFDLVMNLALGIAVGKSMKVPQDGPLGLKNYWLSSIYTGALVEKLVYSMPANKRPIRGLAYLAGLLCNFGHLLLGVVFPPQFYTLNKLIAFNPQIHPSLIEKYLLGVDHEQIGSWLMKAWKMPQEVNAAVLNHHQEDFNGEFCVYSNLVYLANRMLKRHNLGDAENAEISPQLLESLGLTETQILCILEEVTSKGEEWDSLAKQICR
jgi:HD-like signal output (HDOD) protein